MGLKASVRFNFGCAAAGSGGEGENILGEVGETQFLESVTTRLHEKISKRPLRSDVLLARTLTALPCRSFPAQRLCHSRRGPTLPLLFISSRPPPHPPETLEFTFLPPLSFNPQAAEAERSVTQKRGPIASGIARAREVQPVLQLSSSNPGRRNLIENPRWGHFTLSAQPEQR